DCLIQTFNPAFFAHHDISSSADELPVCIVGMMRSGTTLVERIVSAHRDVVAGGELTFWTDHAPSAGDAASIGRHGSDYLALLRQIAPEAARVTDKNPFNFLWLGPIHAALAGARFIHCRRDPIDT